MQSKFAVKGHPLHPMLVALPMGLFVWVVIADLVYLQSRDPVWFAISYWSCIGGIVGALLAALPGFGDFFTLARHTRAARIATAHMVLNLFLVVLFVIATLRMRGIDPLTGAGFGGVFALHLVGVLALCGAGWLGGEMVYRHRLAVLESEHPAPRPHHAEPHEVPLRHIGS